ncbi:hypothetical protein ES705_31122 [subsurface metagenome]
MGTCGVSVCMSEGEGRALLALVREQVEKRLRGVVDPLLNKVRYQTGAAGQDAQAGYIAAVFVVLESDLVGLYRHLVDVVPSIEEAAAAGIVDAHTST